MESLKLPKVIIDKCEPYKNENPKNITNVNTTKEMVNQKKPQKNNSYTMNILSNWNMKLINSIKK